MAKTRIVRVLRNGQITIPKDIRDELGLADDGLVQVSLEGGTLMLHPIRRPATVQGSPWLKELYDIFAPVRERFAESGMPEEEINAELDAAVREARAEMRRSKKRAS